MLANGCTMLARLRILVMKMNKFIPVLLIVALITANCSGRKMLGASDGTVKTEPGFGPAQVYVPGGPFTIGSSLADNIAYTNDVHKRETRIAQFLMDEHEVTNADWKLFVADKGSEYLPNDTLTWLEPHLNMARVIDYYNDEAFATFPVVGITWEQAVAYCEWRTEKVRAAGDESTAPFRLPTEAEWEYAAISLHHSTTESQFETVEYGKTYPWYGTGLREPDEKQTHGRFLANFSMEEKGVPPTKEVRSYWPNDFYLFDMAGNVNEWVNDQYQQFPGEKVATSAEDFPLFGVTTLVNEKSRVIKGGSWEDDPHWLVPATRRHLQKDQAASTIGFRTVRSTHLQGKLPAGQKMKKADKRKPIKK